MKIIVLVSLVVLSASLLAGCGGSSNSGGDPGSSSSTTSSSSSSSSSDPSSSSSSSASSVEAYTSWQQIPRAFPGAQGYGAFATGGRGGHIYYVTSLEDSNQPGTLRHAISQNGPRVILFSVSGYIDLQSNLDIANGDLTILGQTAPGDGITLRGHPLRFRQGVENVVIRFIRSRLGAVEADADALDGRYLNRIMVDHSSFSWSVDETVSLYASNNLTFQWSIVSESLNFTGHEKGEHGYAANWGGVNTSFHNNIIAHHKSRSPRIDGILDKWTSNPHIPFVDGVSDLRNNIFYNYVQYPPYGAEGRDVQFVNNYYKPGPATVSDDVRNFIFLASGRRPLYEEDRTVTMHYYDALHAAGELDPKFMYNGAPTKPVGRVFVDGNYLHGNTAVSNDNVLGVRYDIPSLADLIIQEQPFEVIPGAEVVTLGALDAFPIVLAGAGASLARDSVDARIVYDVENGTASAGGNGIINHPDEVGGYPALESGIAPVDTDGDGIPDEWEMANGLDPNDASDGWQIFEDLNGNYPEAKGRLTNAETYWYSLVKHLPGTDFTHAHEPPVVIPDPDPTPDPTPEPGDETWNASILSLFGSSGSQVSGNILVNEPGSLTITATGGDLGSGTYDAYHAYQTDVQVPFTFTARLVSVDKAAADFSSKGASRRFGISVMESLTPVAAGGVYADMGRFAHLDFYATDSGFVGSRAEKRDIGEGGNSGRGRGDVAEMAIGDYLRISMYYEEIEGETRLRGMKSFSKDGSTWVDVDTNSLFEDVNDNPISQTWTVGVHAAPRGDSLTIEFDSIVIEEHEE